MPATEQRWLVIAVAMVIVAAGGISLLWYEAPGDDETPPTAPTLTLLSPANGSRVCLLPCTINPLQGGEN